MSLEDEVNLEPHELPTGSLPIWIERWPNLTDVMVLEKIKSDYSKDMSVTVHKLVPIDDDKLAREENNSEVAEWCRAHGWKFEIDSNVQGTEDECVVILTRPLYQLYPEYISRARNLLIIVTSLRVYPRQTPEDIVG